MGKRFTASDKWSKEWFQNLSPKLKCLWLYMCDTCDAAGVWEPNFKMASFVIGEQINKIDLAAFDCRINELPCGKVWIVSFIEFQYGYLSRESKAHNPVFLSIEKHKIRYIDRVLIPFGKGQGKRNGNGQGPEGEVSEGEVSEAVKPTVEDVREFCKMGSGIPESFADYYFDQKEIKRTWFNAAGVLINWKREIVVWWNGRRHNWKPAEKPFEIPIYEGPINGDLAKLRKELD